VLRITRLAELPPQITLKVEGRIQGDAVGLLEQECREQIDGGRRVQLDFADVAAIDRHGIAMLRGLRSDQLEIVRAAPFLGALLGEKELL
jgi:ABC-type transporter Mla MlaB component